MRSDLMKSGIDRIAHRALFRALGLTDDQPLVVSFWGSQGAGPLGRASRAIGSSGTLFGSFWGSKRNT